MGRHVVMVEAAQGDTVGRVEMAAGTYAPPLEFVHIQRSAAADAEFAGGLAAEHGPAQCRLAHLGPLVVFR